MPSHFARAKVVQINLYKLKQLKAPQGVKRTFGNSWKINYPGRTLSSIRPKEIGSGLDLTLIVMDTFRSLKWIRV
jgi:hypothetical protein